MTGRRERALVVCPGRGTYGREELGYLARYHGDKADFLGLIDAHRRAEGREPVSGLDARPAFAPSVHGAGSNASALIYACALADVADIDQDRFEIVAVTGNSLGWYLALAAGGALTPGDAVRLVDTMGYLMDAHGAGGQILYPVTDRDWRPSTDHVGALARAMDGAREATGERLYVSIRLGGYRVIAGAEAALDHLLAHLPRVEDRFPMRLARHAAFHTPLLDPVAARARAILGPELFRAPRRPLIDGRGAVWRTRAPDLTGLRAYTLGEQITHTYDFTRAMEVALREFAPDRVILTGPGTSLGPPVAQIVTAMGWWGVSARADLAALQGEDPRILSMGDPAQRHRLVSPIAA